MYQTLLTSLPLDRGVHYLIILYSSRLISGHYFNVYGKGDAARNQGHWVPLVEARLVRFNICISHFHQGAVSVTGLANPPTQGLERRPETLPVPVL